MKADKNMPVLPERFDRRRFLIAAGYSFNAKVPIGWVEAKLTSRGGRFKLNVMDGPSPANRMKELTWRK